MRTTTYLFILLFVLGAYANLATGQSHVNHTSTLDSAKVAEFVDEIKDAIGRFEDRNQAIAAGYRLIGPDFPGMGEHWVQPREVVRRSINPKRPSVLSYIVLDGKPFLTGAAFAMPLEKGQTPPALQFGDVWHVHEGTVEEETLILNPNVRLRGTESEYNLAMFHVWTEFENPDGLFSQDNWALPFFRLGLNVPENVTPSAGKAIFLMNGGDGYYLRLLQAAADVNEIELAKYKSILAQYAEEVTKAVESAGETPDVGFLENVWTRLWTDLRETSSEAVWDEIRELSR